MIPGRSGEACYWVDKTFLQKYSVRSKKKSLQFVNFLTKNHHWFLKFWSNLKYELVLDMECNVWKLSFIISIYKYIYKWIIIYTIDEYT